MKKFSYIIKFLLFTNNGRFRFSYLFPIIGAIIGSYIIFMIYSIMHGMEFEINNRLNAFHYKYYFDDSYKIDEQIKNQCINTGYEEIAYINNSFHNDIVNVYGLSNLDDYIENKINDFVLIKKQVTNIDDILIGDNLASKLNLSLGDTINIYYPSHINVATQIIPYYSLTIGAIYDIDFLDFDNNSIITSLNNLNPNKNINLKYYFDSDMKFNNQLKENEITSNMIIDALKIEKKLYYFFGILVIIISCFMLFQTVLQSIKEKLKQIIIIRILGLKKINMILILIMQNIILITILGLLGILFADLTIYLNLEFDFFNFIYNSLPFNVAYVNIKEFEVLILLFVINMIAIISLIIPMFVIYKENKYVKF